jgi:hypothetical protein
MSRELKLSALLKPPEPKPLFFPDTPRIEFGYFEASFFPRGV